MKTIIFKLRVKFDILIISRIAFATGASGNDHNFYNHYLNGFSSEQILFLDLVEFPDFKSAITINLFRYNLPSFKSNVNKLDLISLSS